MASKRMKILPGRPYRASDLGLDFDVVWGVYVGGCIEGANVSWRLFNEMYGHAHNDSKDEWFGWICILDPKHVLTRTGRPTRTLLHEIAHLLVPNQGHTNKWRKVVTELGAGSEAKRALPRLPSVESSRKRESENLRHAAKRLR